MYHSTINKLIFGEYLLLNKKWQVISPILLLQWWMSCDVID